jgi:hypothetical protein
MRDDGWEIAEIVATETEAELLAGFLRNEEIDARVESRSFRQEPVTVGRMADVRIWVPAPDLEAARRLIAARRQRFAQAGDWSDEES